MRRDVRAHLGSDLRVVDRLLVEPAEQIRRAHQLEPAAEALELRVLVESREVRLVAAREHHAVDVQALRTERDLARLGRDLQVLEGVERALQDVRKFEQAAGGVDQLPEGLEQGHRLQRRRQRSEATIGRDLAFSGVHRELRPERDRADAVAPRNEVALDLDVPQHLLERTVVSAEQRLEHLTALVRELAAQHPRRRRLLRAGVGVHALEQALALGTRQQKQRMIAHLDEQPRVDVLLGQVRVALLAREHRARALAAEADRAAHRLFVREHPMKAVQRALVLRRVVFERAHDARGDGALCRAVRAVEQHHAVGPPSRTKLLSAR